MKINPILAFSARRRMRAPRTALLLSLYGLAVLGFGLATGYASFLGKTLSLYDMAQGRGGYASMMIFQFVMLLLVTPALTAGCISGERERQTLELLLVTNTGSLRIVLGKLAESLGLMLLLIAATLPAMCLVLLSGGITLLQVLVGLLFLGVTAFALLSVGILCSALLRRTVAATVVAYLTVFAIGLVTLIPLIGDAQRMQQLYDAAPYYSSAYVPGAAAPEAGRPVLLLGFILNPALGLLSLLAWQTGEMSSLLSGYYGYSFYGAFNQIDFRAMAWYSMAFMAAAGLALDLLAARFVRPRRGGARQRGSKRA